MKMARTGNPSAKVQKLEANVKKLKEKIISLTQKNKDDSQVYKNKLVEAKNLLVIKVSEAETKGFDKGKDYKINYNKHIKKYFNKFRGLSDLETLLNIWNSYKSSDKDLK